MDRNRGILFRISIAASTVTLFLGSASVAYADDNALPPLPTAPSVEGVTAAQVPTTITTNATSENADPTTTDSDIVASDIATTEEEVATDSDIVEEATPSVVDETQDANTSVTQTTTPLGTMITTWVQDMKPAYAMALSAILLLLIIGFAVRIASRKMGPKRAWMAVGAPVLIVGGLGIFLLYGQINANADMRIGYGYGYGGYSGGQTTIKPSYFLFQTRHVWGTGNSYVQKLTTPAAIQEARRQLRLPINTGSAKRLVPNGTLKRFSTTNFGAYSPSIRDLVFNKDNPTWSWGWDADSMNFVATTAQQDCNRQQQQLELSMAQKDVFAMSSFCPENTYVTREIGNSLPAKEFNLAVRDDVWTYASVPGVNMKLDTKSAAALGKTLHIFTYNPTDGNHIKITDPKYPFHAGEGYVMVSTKFKQTVNFRGQESFSDTLHLKTGWNLVSFPHTAKRRIAAVYSIGTRYIWPNEAVKQQIVLDNPGVWIYKPGKGYVWQSSTLTSLSRATMPGQTAFWMYAYRDVVLQFKF